MVDRMDTTNAVLTLDGLTVQVDLKATEDGPRLELTPVNCNLEGDCPGEYVLTPLHAATAV